MHRHAALIWITMVAATGMVLRLWPMNAHSFWLDEAYSWTMATKFSFSEIVQRTANDFNPPLYYMTLKCWIAVFGESEISQRLLSVTCDVLTILALPGFCHAAFAATHDAAENRASRTIGVLAAALYAVNGIHIHWSIETRMYSIATLLSVVSSWLLLRGLQSADSLSGKALAAGMLTEDTESNRRLAPCRSLQYRWWIGYAISATALLYTHNYGVFTVFGQVCFLGAIFVHRIHAGHSIKGDADTAMTKLSSLPAVTAFAVIGLAYLPWLSVVMAQTKKARDDYWIPVMTWSTIPRTWLDLLVHENKSVDLRDSALAVIVSLISLLVLGCFAWKARNRGKMLVLFMLSSPIVCSTVVSLVSLPIITSRHYLTACAFFFCAAAYVVISMLPKGISNVVAWMLIVNLLFLHFSYRDELQTSDDCGVRAAVHHVAERFQEGDAIVVADQAMLLSVRYYTKRFLPASDAMRLPLPKLFRSVPLKTWLGSSLIDEGDRISADELERGNPKRLWVIRVASDSPAGWEELPLHEWTEQSAVTFRGNYYFERDIRVSLYVPKVPGERGTSVP